MSHQRGEYVKINVASDDLTAAAGDTPEPLGLTDANGNAVTLQAHQRLHIAEFVFALEGLEADAEQTVFIHLGEDTDELADLTAEELLVVVKAAGPQTIALQYEPERLAGPPGRSPLVTASVAGEVYITGVGYIIEDSTEGLRPAWRESINP